MNVRVFLHNRSDAVFHPKMCWFRDADGGSLIVGSGNLTIGGLRANWEAFAVTPLLKSQADTVEKQWSHWTAAHAHLLLPPTDPKVLERASKNTGWARLVTSEDAADGGAVTTSVDEPATRPVQDGDMVLIAEIPKSGDRWNQANFDLSNYEGFFGAKRGTQRRILLWHVDLAGALSAVEFRPSVAVKSQNYRFELDAASGLDYPQTLRPIGVFLRLATRTFRYRLLMPGTPHYSVVSSFLNKKWDGPSTQVKRLSVSAKELRSVWPKSPLWGAS